MQGSSELIQDVPTNIITGFLGVGKTTAITHLLSSKPEDQRWAVLVNEFGEVGVDGSLVQGQHSKAQGVFVSEVPGGCMCCAAGLPMQVALNELLTTARPDRLLIEPTGLGHPKEVLQVLTRSASYRTALSIQRTITLVNACNLDDSRYTDSDIFNQQIEVADVIVSNKTDLYQPGDKEKLQAYVRQHNHYDADILFTTNGKFEYSVLSGAAGFADAAHSLHQSHSHAHASGTATDTLPDCGYVKNQNHNNGYYSVGWRFREDFSFKRSALFALLNGLEAARVKAVMNTDEGVYGYNFADGALTEVQLFGGGQSCVEIISESVDDTWEKQLLQCISD